MMRVGLTGGIASGKTAVSDRLANRGAVIIDADLLAREVVEPGTPGLAAVVARFGATVLRDGRLDRPALGAIVFGEESARRDLEAIIHPAVRRRASEIEKAASAAHPDAIVVHVIPLLVETGQQQAFDRVVVVDVEPEVQLTRLMARSQLSGNALGSADAQARLAAQATREERLQAADYVVANTGRLEDLEEAVDQLWRYLQTSHPTE